MAFGNFVAVRTFVNSIEAEVAKTALEAVGIRALIHRDDCGGIRPSLWVTGIGILVHTDDLALAREILGTMAHPRPTLIGR